MFAFCIDYLLPGAVSIALTFLYFHGDLKGVYFDITENCLWLCTIVRL